MDDKNNKTSPSRAYVISQFIQVFTMLCVLLILVMFKDFTPLLIIPGIIVVISMFITSFIVYRAYLINQFVQVFTMLCVLFTYDVQGLWSAAYSSWRDLRSIIVHYNGHCI